MEPTAGEKSDKIPLWTDGNTTFESNRFRTAGSRKNNEAFQPPRKTKGEGAANSRLESPKKIFKIDVFHPKHLG